MFPVSVERWRSLVTELADGLPVDFVLNWMKEESAGNPCATGFAGVEAGLVQTYHPDDDRYGMTFPELREGCSGQTLTVPLTDARKRKLVAQAVAFLSAKRQRARDLLAKAGASWPEGSSDFGSLVKLIHALPVLALMVPQYTSAHTLAAPDFGTFRRWVLGLSVADRNRLQPALTGRSAASVAHLFDVAEREGAYWGVERFGGFVTVELATLLALVGAALFLLPRFT